MTVCMVLWKAKRTNFSSNIMFCMWDPRRRIIVSTSQIVLCKSVLKESYEYNWFVPNIFNVILIQLLTAPVSKIFILAIIVNLRAAVDLS